MAKDNLDKCFEIYFKINHANFNLEFEHSNYELSRDEKLRASLRPDQLVLDDNYIYIKTKEIAYVNNGKDILKINYLRSNNTLE